MTEPGWYNDEQDLTLARWHDGVGWTRHTVRKAEWAGGGAPPPPVELSEPTPPVEPSTPQGPALGRPEPRVPWGTRPDPVIVEPDTPGPRPAPRPSTPQAPAPAPAPTPAPVHRSTPQPAQPKPPKPPRAKRSTPKVVTAIKRWQRPSWLRWKLVVPVVAGAVVLLALQQAFLTDDAKDPIRSGLPTYGSEWKTVDGSSYRITVVPSNELVEGASPDACITAPTSGHTNLGFAVRIENLSDGSAPFPDVAFAVNANAKGELDLTALSLARANSNIEVTPRAKDAPCAEASMVRPAERGTLAKGGSATFEGVVGGIVEPAPAGLALIVRYVQADETNAGGSSTAEVLAPFPPLPAPTP